MLGLLNHPVSAHAKHKKEETDQTKQNLQTVPADQAQNPIPETHVNGTPAEVARPVPIPFSGSMKDHAHNKLVHFPLALGIAGAIFVFISLRKPELMTAVRILWFLAALGALAAYFTGEAQEEPFEDGAMHEIVDLHENLGIATGISLGVGFFLSLIRRLKGVTAIWAIVVFALISVTGYYGGLLAHSS